MSEARKTAYRLVHELITSHLKSTEELNPLGMKPEDRVALLRISNAMFSASEVKDDLPDGFEAPGGVVPFGGVMRCQKCGDELKS